MTLTPVQTIIIIASVMVATQITRWLPFLIFPEGRRTHPYIYYLGQVLPYAVIGLLVVYSLKNVDLLAGNHGIPEGLAILVIVGLHAWKNNVLLSIGAGTVTYMLLVQSVFV